MQKVLGASAVLRALEPLFKRIGELWRSSLIVGWFFSPPDIAGAVEHSACARLLFSLRGQIRRVFTALRLDRLFERSIFKLVFFWCILPAVLAPLLPTMVVLCLAAVGCFSLLVRAGAGGSEALPRSPVSVYVHLFALTYLAATITSVTVSGSLLIGLLTVFFVLFSSGFGSTITSLQRLDIAYRLLAAAGAAVSLYGIYQYFFYDASNAGAWIDSDMFSEIKNRVYSTLENPNVLAEYLLLVTPLSAACVLTAKNWPSRLLFIFCTALMLACMLLTSSRGGWLGLLFAAFLFVVIWDARFLLAVPVGLLLLYFALPDWAIERFLSIGNMSDSSTSYRVYIWLGTIAMLKDYWFSGIGPGVEAFNRVYPAYSLSTVSAPHSHNLYLQLTCDAGILGLIFFLLAVLAFFRATLSAFFSRARERADRAYLAAAASAVGGFLLQGMTDYSFYNSRVMLLFWVTVALGAAAARLTEARGDPA